MTARDRGRRVVPGDPGAALHFHDLPDGSKQACHENHRAAPAPPPAPLREALERLVALETAEIRWVADPSQPMQEDSEWEAAFQQARAALRATEQAGEARREPDLTDRGTSGQAIANPSPAVAPAAGLSALGTAVAPLLDVEVLAEVLKAVSLGPGYPIWHGYPDKGNRSVVTVKPNHKATAKVIAAEYARLLAAREGEAAGQEGERSEPATSVGGAGS